MGIVSMFPRDWLVDVIVLRGEGKDAKGNPLPVQEVTATDCIIGPRATADPVDRSDVVDSTAVLYRDPEDGFQFLPKDRIRVPAGARMAGDWMVEGRPGEWPHGWEVGLVMG